MELRADLNTIQAFIAVAEAGSYAEASRLSGIPKSTLSRHIASLERRLRVVLIQRSTRSFELTEMGRFYFTECRRVVKDLESIENQAMAAQLEPRGLVRFTAPAEVGTDLLAPLLIEFTRMYPEVELDLVFTDRVVSLIEEKFDLALRTWNVADASLKSRKVGPEKFILTGSPSYLKRKPEPLHPRDLEKHNVIGFSARKDPTVWKLTNGSESLTLRLTYKYQVNTLNVCKRLTLDGLGLSFLPFFYAMEEIRKGRLVRVFPGWCTEPTQFALVYPNQKYIPQKTRALIDFLSPRLKTLLTSVS